MMEEFEGEETNFEHFDDDGLYSSGDESAASYNSEVSGAGEALGFQLDPMMTPERKLEKEKEKREEEEILKKRSEPVENWCKCGNCVAGPPVDNVCCVEDVYVKPLLDKAKIACITLHEGFEPTTLNPFVLDMVRAHLILTVDDNEKKERLRANKNDTKRHLAYVNFRTWVCSGEKLGKGRRMVTPSCVVAKIRSKWPEESNVYVGFQEALTTVEDL
jgi:hypothetical protein